MEADKLSKFASITIPDPDPEDKEKKVFVEYLLKPSTQRKEDEVLETHLKTSEPYCMDPILIYLRDAVLPKDKKDARRIFYQATNYTLVDGILYKRGLSLPLLRCLCPEEGRKVLEKLYAGVRNNHIKSQVLYVCTLQLDYY